MRALFFGVVVLLWGLTHVYVGRRLVEPWLATKPEARRKRLRWIARGAVALSFAIAPTMMILGRVYGMTGATVWGGLLHMGLFVLVLFFVLSRDALLLGAKAIAKLRKQEPDLHRRAFLTRSSNLGILGATGVLGAWGVKEAVADPEVVEVDVPIEGLPAALEGYRIVQLSDVHVGPTIRRPHIERIVAIANGLDADLCAITGDMVDGSVEELRDHVAPLGEIQTKDGTFFCTGNHEYYSGVDEWRDEVRRLGMVALQNEHRVVERGGAKLLVAGVEDYRAPRNGGVTDPHGAKAGAPAHDLSILLAHQPRSVYEAAEAGFDLQISGHTHGGQFFPITLFVGLAQPYTRGLAKHGAMWIYVNRGTGYWGPPLRNGMPSEITLLRLVRA